MNDCTSEITGRVGVGRFVLEIGDSSGAVVREASRTERVHIRAKPTPILVRPRLIRRLLNRQIEVAAALSALDAGLPIELSGEPGIGKTAVLRHLAHHTRAASFVDGIAYVQARGQPFTDLLQLIFEAFYESDEISKPTNAEIRRGLGDKQALIILDDVDLTQHELEQVLDIAPQSAFVVATRARCLWDEVRSLTIKGLSPEDAVLLFEREVDRALDDAERAAATSLCAGLEGHPVRILQAAALVREHGISVDGCGRSMTPATLIAELLVSIDDKQRRALLALSALPGVPLTAQDVSSIAELADVEPALRTLARRGLVSSKESRHRLADGVADQLRRADDLTPWVNRAITYFTAWAARYRRSPGPCWTTPKRSWRSSNTPLTPGAGPRSCEWARCSGSPGHGRPVGRLGDLPGTLPRGGEGTRRSIGRSLGASRDRHSSPVSRGPRHVPHVIEPGCGAARVARRHSGCRVQPSEPRARPHARSR